MLYLVLSSLLIAHLLDRLHSLRISDKAVRHQYRLYEIRDHLREAAINGDVDPENWVFQYLDGSIVKTIDRLPGINLWQGLALWFAYRRDTAVVKAHHQLERELAKPGNEILRRVHALYAATIMLYLMDRHLLFRWFVRNLHLLQKLLQAAAKVQTKAPATSTLVECAFAAA
ncbi:MAG TPA: hypothetical protein VIA62_28000 [Thermoanaerobaculia bacterium]|jgi:hypothetical protein|nr:hypothetical protein [Thermoanaerobaculia bacterium]